MPNWIDTATLSEIKEKGRESLLIKPRKPSVFVKGHTLGGRPKGLKNYRQFSLSYWYELIVREYPKLKPIQRSRIALECWKTLVNKSNNIPSDPRDSRINATVALDALKGLEGTEPPPGPVTVEASPAPAPQTSDSPST